MPHVGVHMNALLYSPAGSSATPQITDPSADMPLGWQNVPPGNSPKSTNVATSAALYYSDGNARAKASIVCAAFITSEVLVMFKSAPASPIVPWIRGSVVLRTPVSAAPTRR